MQLNTKNIMKEKSQSSKELTLEKKEIEKAFKLGFVIFMIIDIIIGSLLVPEILDDNNITFNFLGFLPLNKKLRKEKRYTQKQLAEKLNVSFQAVSKWETGDALPEITKLKALADTFNVTVDFLLDENKAEFLQQSDSPSVSVLDKYADKIDDCVDNISNKSGTFFKKYGWISGIVLILFGIYRIVINIFTIAPFLEFNFFDSISGFALILSIFQILIAIAFIVGGIIIIKKFKPKRTWFSSPFNIHLFSGNNNNTT